MPDSRQGLAATSDVCMSARMVNAPLTGNQCLKLSVTTILAVSLRPAIASES